MKRTNLEKQLTHGATRLSSGAPIFAAGPPGVFGIRKVISWNVVSIRAAYLGR